MKFQLQNESKGPYFQVKTEPQKRKAEGQPVGFKKARGAASPGPAATIATSPFPAPAGPATLDEDGNSNGDFDPMLMMQMFMQMMQMQQMAGGVADAGVAAPAGTPDNVWKLKFHELLNKNNVQGKPEYSVEDVEGGFKGIVTIQEHTFEGDVGKSKKEAQQLAAKAAIQQLFPDDFARLASPNPTQKPGKGQQPKAKAQLEGKSLLNHKLNMYMRKNHQRPLVKEDKKFETELVAKANWVSTLTLGEGLAGRSFQGEGKSKNDAENAAAEEAVRQLHDVFDPIEQELLAAKKQKNQESLAKLKETHPSAKLKKKAEKVQEETASTA
jgi:dsRNA-specific ribonuclease